MAEHPEQKTHYHSIDKASQSNQAEYENMIDSINQAMDPNSNTVLVVDDETPIRKFVSRQIRKSSNGIVIFEAENGQDALEKLEIIREQYNNDPVLIITDLNMPVMDGWEITWRDIGHPRRRAFLNEWGERHCVQEIRAQRQVEVRPDRQYCEGNLHGRRQVRRKRRERLDPLAPAPDEEHVSLP